MNMSNPLIVCAIGASMLSPCAYGQTEKPRYRITDLGDLNTSGPEAVAATSFGLNEQNEVTGEATTASQALHAFIWLPIPAYGLPSGMHDIGPGSSSTRTSRGNDIANTGFVTGRNFFNAFDPFTSHAFVWEPGLSDNDIPSHLRMKDLGELIPELLLAPPCDDFNITSCDPDSLPIPATNSEGWSISSSGFAVGASGTVVTCPQEGVHTCPNGDPNCMANFLASFTTDGRGFLDDTLNPANPLDLDLKPHDTTVHSRAYSISTNNFGASPLVVGRTLGEGETEDRDATPVYWPDVEPALPCTEAIPFTDFAANGAGVPRDINDLLNVVGYGCIPDGNQPNVCGQGVAYYWDSVTTPRIPLPHPLDPDELSPIAPLQAVAINTPQAGVGVSLLRAVGWAGGATGSDAMLWEKQSGEWVGSNLNNNTTMVDRGNWGTGTLWELEEAHDINNLGYGSIVGKAKRMDLPGVPRPNRAFLLTPLGSCPEDNNPINPNGTAGDGVIDILDLIAIINAFDALAPCPSGSICWADVTGDFMVNIEDLIAVINAFGPGGCTAQYLPGTMALQLTDISTSFETGWPDAQNNITPSPLVAAAWNSQQATAPLKVLRLWATVDDPNAILNFAGGGVASGPNGSSEPLILSAGKGATFFVANNNYSTGVDTTLLNVDGGTGNEWFQSQAWSTHLALGTASNSTIPTKLGNVAALDGIINAGSVNEPNVGWSVINPSPGQGVVPDGNGGWRILIGQFAIPHGSTFTAAVRLTGDGIDTYATINSTSQVLNP